MSDFAQFAIILAVAAGLFFWLGIFFSGGRNKAATPARPERKNAPPAADPRIAELERELASAKQSSVVLEDELAKARALLSGDSEPGPTLAAGAETDPELGAIYAVRPEAADDLTQIRGVGKALAGQLNSLGVYTLTQIATWEKSQIEAFSTRLSFKDRIVRDDWVGQARRLGA